MPRSHHAEWLELVEVSGPFLTLPVLERVFPQGLDAPDPDQAAKLRLAHEEWAEERSAPVPDLDIHAAWIRFVLTETLEFTPEILLEGEGIPAELTVEVPEQAATLHPDLVLADPDGSGPSKHRLLIQTYPPEQDLDGHVEDGSWAASPAERMTQLCRATEVRLGLVTNGERWMLVDAPRGETAGYVSFYASLFSEEPLTLRAFRSLLGARRFFWVDPTDTLEAMLAESGTYQAEVTAQLGAQVRRAVEVLVQSLDRADADTGRDLLRDVPEAELYEASLTVMMRLVFLFFAEENDLLPLSDDLYQANYAASTLRAQLREEADRVGVEVLERRQDAWCRLLATFRAIHGGVDHDQLHLPAYGGSLFDPDRFPFLEGRMPGTSWTTTAATPLPVDNRTVLHLLDALQLLRMKARSGTEARRLSFRSLDIEQIGHVYEMLLDHTAVRALGPGLGLVGAKGTEPEVGIEELEALEARGHDALVEALVDETKKSKTTIARALAKDPDPAWAAKLQLACGQDEELYARVLPYHALVRTDPWGEPVVIPTGAVYVTSGIERRSTGTYYTPKALTEEIVTHALEPVVYRGPAEGTPREDWKLLAPAELLELKVCDPAMGSGAFLVQVVRWLSERLLEAWEKAEEATGGSITPEGTAPSGGLAELVVPTDPEERAALARRLVADRCVYGVDVNPLAVEMAKLSLWLVTLAKGRPFSFLDHALRCGDSLLGVHDLDQIRAFHPDPTTGGALHATFDSPIPAIEEATSRALELRRELESFTVKDVRDAEHKAELQREAERDTVQVKLLGDLVIGAALSTAEAKGKGLDRILTDLAREIPEVFADPGGETEQELHELAWEMLNAGKPPLRPERRPFHWPVEFPEVFSRERPGFDAIVGNPPFLGGQKISGAAGTDYREYLVGHIAEGSRGSGDLVVYFFLRAAAVAARSSLGLLATNTISQGDTREIGLDRLCSSGWTVVRAWKSRSWPGAATVVVAIVWLQRNSWRGIVVLDGQPVRGLTSSLDPVARVSGLPHRLAGSRRLAFIGSNILGSGFLLEPDAAHELISRDDRYQDVLFPFLNGDDLNKSPSQVPTRWAICFFDWPLERAREYPACLAIVDSNVRPDRERNTYSDHAREHWWQYERLRGDLYEAISSLGRVIALTRHSSTLAPLFVPTGWIYSDALALFASDDLGQLGVLNSSIHQAWVTKYASTIGRGIRYTPSDCFETFPRVDLTRSVARVSEELNTNRQVMMRDRGEGLTKTYNRLHDPKESSNDVEELRVIHANLDHTVAAAYGWTDLDLGHDFHETQQGIRFTVSSAARIEILDRLLELNHERHEAEVKAGLAQ